MTLFYRKLGKGKPLVILHGLFGSSDNWLPFARDFSDSFEVYLPDLRNHGHSPHHEEMNYEVMGRDILEFFDTHRIHTAILLGHSMGGKVAMQFALENSTRVERLIVAESGIKSYPIDIIPYIEVLRNIDLKSVRTRQEMQHLLMEKIKDSRLVLHFLKNMVWSTDKRLEWRVNMDTIYKHIHEILSGIAPKDIFNRPCLFIRGALSDYVKDEDLGGLKEIFTGMQLVTIVNAAHWVQVDNMKDFVNEVDMFISL